MSNGWIDADGNRETSTSNLVDPDKAAQHRPNPTTRGVSREVQMPFDGGPAKVVEQRNGEYNAWVPEGYNGSVIGSARTAGGDMIMNRRVTSQDRVTLPQGIQTSVAVAANMGYLVRNGDGTFSDAPEKMTIKDPTAGVPTGKPDAAAPDHEGDGDAEGGFAIGDDGEAAMKSIVDSVLPGDAIKALDEVLKLGGVSDNTLSRMASHAQVEPEVIAEQLAAAHQGFYDATLAHLEEGGVANLDAFEAFIRSTPQAFEKLTKGARDLVMSNKTEEIDSLRDAFIEKADIYMPADVTDALDEAGYDWRKLPDGRIQVNIGGMDVPWQVAVRQQHIRFI
jgi:hypothetical protein